MEAVSCKFGPISMDVEIFTVPGIVGRVKRFGWYLPIGFRA